MKKLILHNKAFTVLITLFYILGIIAKFYGLEIVLSCLSLFFLVILLFYFKYGSRKIIFLYLIFFLGIFIANNSLKLDSTLDNFNCSNAKIVGRIITSKAVFSENNKVKFYIKANKVYANKKEFDNLNTKIFVSLDINDDINQKIQIGNTVEIKGKLRTVKEASNPYQFNYKKYLENNDTKNVLYGQTKDLNFIKAPLLSKNIENDWYYILNKFEKTRVSIINKHSKYIKSPYLEVLGGIVFGDETIKPNEEIKENFKNSGLLHLLAASGLNVALIFGLWWWIASVISLPYNFAIYSGISFVVFYTFMTGFPPSILRASLMLLFVLIGKIIDRSANSVALIFFVAFLILLYNPKMFFDVGFQLSFIVTFGLIVCCPIIIEKFSKIDEKFIEKHKNETEIKKKILFLFSPKKLASIVLIPLIAQLWVMPLQMHYFNNLAPLSVFANILVTPFIGILSFLGFIGSIIALIPLKFIDGILFIIDFFTKYLLILLVKISEIFASLKYSLVTTVGLNIFQMFNFWFVLLILTLNIKNSFKNKKHIFILILCSFIFIASIINFNAFNKDFEISMFDVENADSFLIKTPKNKYILIDTGRKTYKGISSATGILNPYFINNRINKLEMMIVTHFDIDHCGGVIDVLKLLKCKTVYIQSEKSKSQHSFEILKYLNKTNQNYKIAKNNEVVYFEKDLKITTYVADVKNSSSQDKLDNETSIITLVQYKNKNILFMGDSGIIAFEKIQKYLPDKIDILKIGHHGAKNVINQEIINRIKPTYVLISTGINKYNHPHYSTISLLNKNNVKIVSTKNYGFVKIKFKDDKILFSHFEKQKMLKILFEKTEKIPFHKTVWVQNFIKNNL